MPAEQDIEVALRWADMDANRHVNNVEFFRILEEARARWFPTTGDGASLLASGIVVASQGLDYAMPLSYRHEPVLVGLRVTRVGTSSFTLSCRIHDASADSDDRVYAAGNVVMVAVDDEAGRSRPFTVQERSWLESLSR
ncbi:thioesterase family protein [Cryobacterium sp. PH29-G1]|nr:thioesterase family protein [Cryobacterium sp. PH29-G1]MDJ0349649.1 thioesterase family protein [Cryobacterium sp. PH29-G1]